MPRVNTSELNKLYYSISEVAEMFDVNMSLIRFWEKEFPVLQPKKNNRGTRYYSPKEIEKLDRIYELVKLEGYTLEGAKKAFKTKKSTSKDEVSVADEITKAQDNEDLIAKLELVSAKLKAIKNRI